MTPTIAIERPIMTPQPHWLSGAAPSSVLPPPVARFVDLASHGHVGPIDTVEMTCDAWMRRPWWLPIPLQIRMSHRLGYAFVHEIRIGRGPFSRQIGLDAFVDGRGAMIVGRSTQTGRTFDQGARIAMWGEALTFPASWLGRTDVGWESVDEGIQSDLAREGAAADPSRGRTHSRDGAREECAAGDGQPQGRRIHASQVISTVSRSGPTCPWLARSTNRATGGGRTLDGAAPERPMRLRCHYRSFDGDESASWSPPRFWSARRVFASGLAPVGPKIPTHGCWLARGRSLSLVWATWLRSRGASALTRGPWRVVQSRQSRIAEVLP